MLYLPGYEVTQQMNQLGSTHTPFFFMFDFEGTQGYVEPLPLAHTHIRYQLATSAVDQPAQALSVPRFTFEAHPISFAHYAQGYSVVQHYLEQQEVQLVNYTQPTPMDTSLSLEQLFDLSHAPYKLLVDGHFVCFSPETFVRIAHGRISTNPMKGTIDATIPNARQLLLDNPKELQEHQRCVELLRADLQTVSNQVHIERFRYIDSIQARGRQLLQTSSQLCGTLPANYHSQLGTIIRQLLPAGSILGSPRDKALEVIKQAEGYTRGFYTGVFGVYNGSTLDSAVLIRFVEHTPTGLVYKSGGGITLQSTPQSEYQEMINKVYVPIY